jgi:PEP-CTERM motif
MIHRTWFALAVAAAAVGPGTGRAQVIAFDASSTGQLRGTQTLSWSHTVGAGNNRLLVVGTATEAPVSGNSVVTGITYGGVAMTQVTGAQQTGIETGVGENYADLWFMLNPPVGTANVSVTVTGMVADLMGGGVSFRNVRQQAPEAIGGAGTTSTTFTNLSANITTVSADSLVVDMGLHSTSGGTMTPGAGQIEAWDQFTVGGARSAFSYRFVPAPGTITDSWTADLNPQGRMAMSLTSFAPVAAVPEPSSVILASAGGLLFAAWRRRGRASTAS